MNRLAWASVGPGSWVARRGRAMVGRVERVDEPREGWAATVVHADGSDEDAGVWATVEGAQRGVESRVG